MKIKNKIVIAIWSFIYIILVLISSCTFTAREEPVPYTWTAPEVWERAGKAYLVGVMDGAYLRKNSNYNYTAIYNRYMIQFADSAQQNSLLCLGRLISTYSNWHREMRRRQLYESVSNQEQTSY